MEKTEKFTMEVLEEKRKPNVFAMSSICPDGSHVIIWDFDVTKSPSNLNHIEKALKPTQRNFLLSTIYIMESRNGYNAICLDKLDKETVASIKNLTPGDDKRHLEVGIKRSWFLRFGYDKNIVSQLSEGRFNHFTKSNPHRIALKNFFNYEIEKDRYFDDETQIYLAAYWDWKRERRQINGSK